MNTNKQMICATPEGLKIAEEALKKWCYGEELNLSKKLTGCVGRSTIQKFFKGEKIKVVKFQDICKELKIDWEEIAGLKNSPELPNHETPKLEIAQESQIDIDALVEQMRKKVSAYIRKNCGTMKVLDMTQEIGLDDIYTDVNILEKITSRRPKNIEKILAECKIEDLERFSLNTGIEERIPGLAAVERYSKLMIFGKPGAGKTTFLKRIAIQCDSGKFLANRLPIFITLKSFAEAEKKTNLLKYIYSEYSINDISERESIKKNLQQGRAIVLLDGLDEVKQEDDKRVVREIRKFIKDYDASLFIITCRIAAKQYVFEHFTDIEMADFDDDQIKEFVTKWFKIKDAAKAETFIEKIEENQRIKELATNPLRLTFLCWLFSESVDFPENRADLYEQGLEILLRKWDGTRSIERDQVYRKLPTKRKEDLLSEIAFTTFQEGNYFFKQRQLEEYISNYLQNLPDAQTDPEALLVDSRAVLKSIESQHGLFVERARNIYSFSHLTFHEYFTARNIYTSRNQKQELEKLVEHITEPRWREVFLLTGGMLKEADDLVLLMKHKIDQLLANDEKFQHFLKWLEQKSSSVKVFYKPAAVRAFYLECDLFLSLNLSISLDLDRSTDRLLGFDLKRSALLDLDRSLYRYLSAFRGYRSRSSISSSLLSTQISILYFLSLSLDEYPKLQQKLQELEEQLPNTDEENWDNLEQWVEIDGRNWTEQLRAVMMQYRNIGHDWQFNENQKKLLQQYYDANYLLVDCLKECHLTRSVREEIENTLLLPVQKG
ncbi:MAG TPA: NACHT domain-containing NTPase [Nostocaceae cyanobacterium]|nr:NACHT domain-containing NTPase [Nostocaceae cyanobacterium]